MHLGRCVSHRVVLKDSVLEETVDDYLRSLGWVRVGHVDRNPEEMVQYGVRWNVDEVTSVHLTVDDFAELRYVTVAGESWEEVGRVLNLTQGGLDVWTRGDLIRDADAASSSDDAQNEARSVFRLGVGAPLAAENTILVRVEAAARSQNEIVRRAALWAMAYSQWPEYRETLRWLAGNDPILEISRQAEIVLDGIGDGEAGS